MASMVVILKVFNCYWLLNSVGWSRNFMESIRVAWRFRIATIVRFWYPRWPPWQPFWKSSNCICSRTLSLSLNLMGGIGVLSQTADLLNSSNHISQTVVRLSRKLVGILNFNWKTMKEESWRRNGTHILWEWDTYFLAGTPTFYRRGVSDSYF